jgi:hypothetical protein
VLCTVIIVIGAASELSDNGDAPAFGEVSADELGSLVPCHNGNEIRLPFLTLLGEAALNSYVELRNACPTRCLPDLDIVRYPACEYYFIYH